MTLTHKLLAGFLLSLALFTFYAVYWLIFPNPHELVDCKVGRYIFEIERHECIR
jgi:hypothetical protein